MNMYMVPANAGHRMVPASNGPVDLVINSIETDTLVNLEQLVAATALVIEGESEESLVLGFTNNLIIILKGITMDQMFPPAGWKRK